jgi:hypothetical protein
MVCPASGEVGTPDSKASDPDWLESIAEIDGTLSVEARFGRGGDPMTSRFSSSDPKRRKSMLTLFAHGALAPGELLGELLDTYDEARIEQEFGADEDQVRQQVRAFLSSYRPPRIPFAVFGRIAPAEAELWKGERDRKYAAMLGLLGIEASST